MHRIGAVLLQRQQAQKLENKQVEIKLSEEYDVERLNGSDFNTYCDEIGKYFYSYDGTGIFVHEFSDEE